MSEAYPRRGSGRSDCAQAAARCVADRLSLAAAPTFVVMALLTSILGGAQPTIVCLGAEQTSPLSGMIPMYLLMSAFHLPPWLKLISSRRKRASARPVFAHQSGLWQPTPKQRCGHGIRPPGRALSAKGVLAGLSLIGILLIAAPAFGSDSARQVVHGYAGLGNAVATRGRHVGWCVAGRQERIGAGETHGQEGGRYAARQGRSWNE
jgi:hypothetical protein